MKAPATVKQDSSTMNFAIELTTTHIDDFDKMEYTAYGIRATDKDGNILALYPDISTSKEFVQGFLNIVESRDVAAVHIKDLLEDYLD